MNTIIRYIDKTEWEEAMALAWRTFQRFDAIDYTKEGEDSFLNFISDQGLYRMFCNGDYKVFAAYQEGNMIGIISLRKRTHISLLFVDEKYHGKGIGTELVDHVAKFVRDELKLSFLTVNAAPAAVEFYRKIGFEDAGTELINDGIKYTPMVLKWD